MGKYAILIFNILIASTIISSCNDIRSNQPIVGNIATETAQQPGQTPSTALPLMSPCNAAQYVDDVTIPDNTEFPPGQKFTKVWEIKNIGTCVWDSAYQAFHFSGDQLSASDFVPLDNERVDPNDTVTISVEMISPDIPGTPSSG